MNVTKPDQEGGEATEGQTRKDELVLNTDAMDRFVKVFEASARRWELVIYPTMLAFVILAAYGFFLIYTLSRDIHTLAEGMDPQMGEHLTHISDSVAYLSENVRTMTRRMDRMTNSIDDISVKMNAMENLDPMLTHIRGMDASMRNMTITGDQMRNEMSYMGRNIGRPLSKMNSFFPW
jgi:hypothetical protein